MTIVALVLVLAGALNLLDVARYPMFSSERALTTRIATLNIVAGIICLSWQDLIN